METDTEKTICYHFQKFRDFSTEPDSKKHPEVPNKRADRNKQADCHFLKIHKRADRNK